METFPVSANGPNDAKAAEAAFQEKMRERMRQAMGDLMPDAVLQGIVAKGIDEAFLKPRRVQVSSYQSEDRPSWLIEFLDKELKVRVQQAIEKWAKENEARIKEEWGKAIDRGLASACVGAFDRLLANSRNAIEQAMSETIDNLRR